MQKFVLLDFDIYESPYFIFCSFIIVLSGNASFPLFNGGECWRLTLIGLVGSVIVTGDGAF
jgi:hypothetical protein